MTQCSLGVKYMILEWTSPVLGSHSNKHALKRFPLKALLFYHSFLLLCRDSLVLRKTYAECHTSFISLSYCYEPDMKGYVKEQSCVLRVMPEIILMAVSGLCSCGCSIIKSVRLTCRDDSKDSTCSVVRTFCQSQDFCRSFEKSICSSSEYICSQRFLFSSIMVNLPW